MVRDARGLAGLSILLTALLVVLSAVFPAAAEPARLTALRHDGSGGDLRLIFDVTPVPGFTVFTISGPDRVVLDFPQIEWRIGPDAAGAIPQIGSLRFGLFRHDRARVILTLTEPMLVKRAFAKPPRGAEPGRLVIDLSRTTRERFDQAAGVPENARWSGAAPVPPEVVDGDVVIALDPGHGGIDPGASSGRLTEKKVVLAFAKFLAQEIDRQPGLRAYLVRDRDEFVPLSERVARAHAAGANALISIHADSVEEGNAHGVSVYTLSDRGTDLAAEAFAARENRSDVIAGADLGGESDELTRLLVELAQRGTQDESGKLGAALIRALEREVDLLRSRPLRRANFRVLKAPDLPSVLLELGFLDSPRDQARLTDPEWRRRAAQGVVAGLVRWRAVASRGFVESRTGN